MTEQEKTLAQKLYEVFELLRDSDKFPKSGTSLMLKENNAEYFAKRAEQEFQELQGCVAGTHRHSDDFKTDFLLESSQVFYWLALTSVIQKKSFEEFLIEQASSLLRLEKIHTENDISLKEIFEKDLKDCEEKGYLTQ